LLNVLSHVIQVLDEVLALGGRGLQFNRQTPLLGAVPELDASAFASVGALTDFVSAHSGV
jgi:acyl carrier protein